MWKKSIINYLDVQKGEKKVPLLYVLCSADATPNQAENEHQRLILEAPLVARGAYMHANHAVYQILKNLVLEMDACGNGCDAFAHILRQYEGMADKLLH